MYTELPKDEAVTLALQELFEHSGYVRYRMSSFESYDYYLANKSFLKGEGLVTFNDAFGRLLALKPDVTMSIVKNTKPETVSQKLYYVESVFRARREGGEVREIRQMGVESIGTIDAYAEAEVAVLAAKSLAAVGGETVLSIGDASFVAGLYDALGLSDAVRAKANEALGAKSAETLRALAENGAGEALAQLAALCGKPDETLERARALCRSQQMEDVVARIQGVCEALAAVCPDANVRVDFSLESDMDYYNGLVLQGFVRGVPQAVLTGGRYDPLMRKCEKPQSAVGFALVLDGLSRAFPKKREFDADVLLLYAPDTPPAAVARAAESLAAEGVVRAETRVPPGFRAGRTVTVLADGTITETEVSPC